MKPDYPPDARILLTAPVSADSMRGLAASVPQGSVTILGGAPAALPDLRHRYAEWENIMISPGDREDIPWADGRFVAVVDSQPGRPTPEILRVLAPGGSILGFENLTDAL